MIAGCIFRVANLRVAEKAGSRLLPRTPLPSADTMRSDRSEHSTHHCASFHRRSVSVPCLALSGTSRTVFCHVSVIAHPTSCLPSLKAVLLPAPLHRRDPQGDARRRHGSMKALTPAGLTQIGGSLRLLRFAFPAFRPQPRLPSNGRFVSRLSAISYFRASPRMSRLATALRRIRFVIPGLRRGRLYGLPVHLQLLSTPPRGDAVTFDYGAATSSRTDSHRADKASLRTHSFPRKREPTPSARAGG